MYRSILLAACMVAGTAQASTLDLSTAVAVATAKIVKAHSFVDAFNVGDINNYSLSVAGMQGTMVMKVAAIQNNQLTINQDMSIMGQQQNAVEVVDMNTGEIISITVNGQKQTVPPAGDEEITSHTAATITVPAGTFNCQDVKVHSKSQNTDAEQWVDMSGTVGVGGMLKMTTTQQGMPIEADLTSYTKL